ncbi:MAG: pyridoxal phosphate-dependent aminotransferase [Deltaproteobacteria bacterium]|nr:pyridoxal phosphate-dependent aminotransferase [Deltaproteobacteria bacterium]
MPSLSTTVNAIRPGMFAELQQRIEARGGDLVPLQIGDTAVDPPPEARFTSDGSADPALYRYGSTVALGSLRSAIARWLGSVRGIADVDPEREVLVGCGGTHAIFCAARTILDEGDEVLLAAPYWPLSPGVLATCGARVVEVPLTDRLYADPSLDAAEPFRARLTPRTRALYLITPNNPDGKILSRAQLAQIAAFAREHDLWVIADEVYADHAFDAPHVSMATLDGMRARTITAYSLSKSHALAGARIGYLVAPPEVVVGARRVSTHTIFNVPVITQRAALAALEAGPRWVDDARARYREARDVAVARLRDLPVDFAVPEGGTYLFVDFARVLRGRPPRVLLEAAIDRGVIVAPGAGFGADYASCARLCYSAVSPERLVVGLDRLREAVDSLV